MRFEEYMCDGERTEITEDRFNIFHKFLVFVQCTHAHVVLSKEKTREKNKKNAQHELNERSGQKKTDLYGSPPGKGDAPHPILEGNAPAIRDEALHLKGFYVEDQVAYHLLRLCHRLRFRVHPLVYRLVKVDFSHRSLNRAQQIPRGAYVDFVNGRGR